MNLDELDEDVVAELMAERAATLRRIDALVEEDPQDRGDEVECWCPDIHREAGLHVRYCPRHGTAPDPDLIGLAG